MNKITRIMLSLAVVGGVVGAAVVGTSAYFSDTETSEGNVLAAGSIDLLIDNHSWYYGPEGLVERGDLGWEATNLDGNTHLFFDYADMKPGDWGEDTVSLHVNDNDAWACVDLYVTTNDDMSTAEPETDIGDDVEDPQNPWDGELAENLYLYFWVDDGDNVYEEGEEMLTHGPASAALNGGLHYTLADSVTNNVGESIEVGMVGEKTYYIGKYWCYGVAQPEYVSQDGFNTAGPDVRQTSGFTCDGGPVDNWSQSDAMTADISFYAVQKRHNAQFECSTQYTPADMTRLRLENKDENWDVIADGRYGILDFKNSWPTFDYTLNVYDLEPNTDYVLHYYKDPWPSNGGIVIDAFTTDVDGDWSGSNSVELNANLPTDAADANYPNAKIWVTLAEDVAADGRMTDWDPTRYLYEVSLVQYVDTDL